MTGKTAVVTGGGLGLGRATAVGLAEAGYNVAVIGRTRSKLDGTVELIGADRALAVQAELADPDQVTTAFRQIEDRFGSIDALVNNAAAYRLFHLEKATNADIDEVIDGTLKQAMYCMREAIPRMRAAGGGDIVNVSSESVRLPAPYLLAYVAAKMGLEALTDGLRYELKGSGIRCMVFQAGVITVSSGAATMDPAVGKDFTDSLVKGGFAPHYSMPGVTPQDMAATIVHMITIPRPAGVEFVNFRHM